jgi:predicted acyl esterase
MALRLSFRMSAAHSKAKESIDRFVDDQADGYDTIEWLAKQSWSNSKIGMYGASAMGIAANEAAMANPPHLVAAFRDGGSFECVRSIELHRRCLFAKS